MALAGRLVTFKVCHRSLLIIFHFADCVPKAAEALNAKQETEILANYSGIK